MRMRVLSLLAAMIAGPAVAQDQLPALYDVTGVASDDVLNIREAPDAGSAIIGSFAADADGVEVIAESGGWARVNSGERAGWASQSFLARQPGQWQDGLPDIRACFGTEPFWSLTLDDGTYSFSLPGEDPETGRIETRARATGRTDRFAFAGGGLIDRAILIAGIAECSDGMSDMSYGLTADLIVNDTLYAGCCTLAQR